ncbi:MAG: hypothetical protein ACE367_05315 [Acidimicrobiales bacterium]
MAAVARLDKGRLCARSLTTALGWEPGDRLTCDVTIPETVILARTWPGPDPVIATSTPHLDNAARVLLPIGLRCHLGLAADSEVFATTTAQGTLKITSLGRVLAALDNADTADRNPAAAAGDPCDGDEDGEVGR